MSHTDVNYKILRELFQVAFEINTKTAGSKYCSYSLFVNSQSTLPLNINSISLSIVESMLVF